VSLYIIKQDLREKEEKNIKIIHLKTFLEIKRQEKLYSNFNVTENK